MIDTLIFDFDGVIIDTETPDFETWQDVFHAHGVHLDRSLWEGIIGGGVGRFDPCQHLEDLARTKLDQDSIKTPRRKRYLERVEASPLLPGVLDYLCEAGRIGLRLGVASSSTRDWVEGHLSKRGLIEYFDSITCRDDVSEVKPSPKLYLTSVSRLGASPPTTVAIEDSANGVSAAKRAGLLCVVVPNQMTRNMDLSQADVRLGSLSDAPLAPLIAMLAERPQVR